MAPDGCTQTAHGFMTEYRIVWYHQQGSMPATQRGHPTYTIRIGTPLPAEKYHFYGMGCTHRAEVHCGKIDLLLACNYNHDDDVLCNPQVLSANLGSATVALDTRPNVHPDGNIHFKLHRATDRRGNGFVDLYMHLWDSTLGEPLDVLIFGKKVVDTAREGLTPRECYVLGIPEEVWKATEEAKV